MWIDIYYSYRKQKQKINICKRIKVIAKKYMYDRKKKLEVMIDLQK